jgi:hypothetical protein
VVGALPTTSAVTGEKTYGYSYLDYIKASSGVAMHITNNNWAAAISKMVTEIGIAKNPVITVAYPIVTLKSITVNGAVLNSSEYSVSSSDNRTIEITKRPEWPSDVTVVVSYTHL